MQNIWLITGVSGCGWAELLSKMREEAKQHCPEKNLYIFDVGYYMQKECERMNISILKEDILDVDGNLLEAIRSLALKNVISEIKTHADEDAIFFIGIHAVFQWKNRLIPGVSYYDLGDPDLNLSGVVNVIDDIDSIISKNEVNPVRKNAGKLSAVETQRWMEEEELLSKTIADIKKCPFYIIARNHDIRNLLDLFLGIKKRVYLSYPITAIREERPEELESFQKSILPQLNEFFVVFNPLAIQDLGRIEKFQNDAEYSKIADLINARTVQRDFRFINQSHAVVVYYNTEKNSPGVFAEIYYAYRTGKPVFVFYPQKISPFLKEAVTSIDNDLDVFMKKIKEYADGAKKDMFS